MSDTDTKYTAPSFIHTFTGKEFYPLDPRPEDITIIDIAHALSQQCRYSGHTAVFYSTAQHCNILCDFVEKRGGTALDCLQILMHDSAEAYLVDVPRPIKQHMPQYRGWDNILTHTIRRWAFGELPIPKWQDELDSGIIQDERKVLFAGSTVDWKHLAPALDVTVEPVGSLAAERGFLTRYAKFSYLHHKEHQYLRHEWGFPMMANVTEWGAATSDINSDLVEVDIRGGVGRLAMKDERGMMVRDRDAAIPPRPLYKWVHGRFDLVCKTVLKMPEPIL